MPSGRKPSHQNSNKINDNYMKRLNLLLLFISIISIETIAQSGSKKTLSETASKNGTDSKMNSFVANLMSKMTLDEKIGQLNLLTPGGGVATGAVVSSDVGSKIKAGSVGGLFGVI